MDWGLEDRDGSDPTLWERLLPERRGCGGCSGDTAVLGFSYALYKSTLGKEKKLQNHSQMSESKPWNNSSTANCNSLMMHANTKYHQADITIQYHWETQNCSWVYGLMLYTSANSDTPSDVGPEVWNVQRVWFTSTTMLCMSFCFSIK